jgi:hypothetical protein
MKKSFLPTILLVCALMGAFTIGYLLRDAVQPEMSSRGRVAWERDASAQASRRIETRRPRSVDEDESEAHHGRFREGIPIPMSGDSWGLSPSQRPTPDGPRQFSAGLVQAGFAMPQLRAVALPIFFVPVAGGRGPRAEKDTKKDEPKKEREPSYVVFGPGQDDAAFQSVKEILTGAKKGITVGQAETLSEGIQSKANVLILLPGRGSIPRITSEIIKPFKRRKVIGIGIGAAEIFEAAGLKVGRSNVAFGPGSGFAMTVQKNSVMNSMEAPISVFDPPLEKDDPLLNESIFAYYVGPQKPENRKDVEVIALWKGDEDFAPIAREGKAVLIGVDGRIDKWGREFRELVGKLAAGLAGK